MEFVPHPIYPSMMIAGPRVRDDRAVTTEADVESVLVAIVKGTFDAGVTASPPAADQVPLRLQDQFFNLVRNGGFFGDPAAEWKVDGPTISLVLGAERRLRVTGAGEVRQVIALGGPAGGRTLRLTFRARASSQVTVAGIRLEPPSGAPLFVSTRLIEPAIGSYLASGTWPAAATHEEATLVLAGSAAAAIDYAQVQIVEGQTTLPFDADDPIREEHDLALFKPATDVVVLGKPARPPGGAGAWTEEAELGGATLSKAFTSTTPPLTFGWQPRTKSPRKDHAGATPVVGLPTGFRNRFFNGGTYTTAGDAPPFSHPGPDAVLELTTRTPAVSASKSVHLPTAPRVRLTLTTGDHELDPVADTIVYDKDSQRFTVVWRAVWRYDDEPRRDRYVRLSCEG